MQEQEFKVVYDILQEGYLGLTWFPLLWFLGAVIMSIFFVKHLIAINFKVKGINDSLVVVIFPIFLIVGVLGILSTFYTQWNCISWAKSHTVPVTEGQIDNLKTESKYETFTVNGIKLEHREYDVSKCGYTQAKGVKLQNRNPVRITYHEGCILKLEVAK